MTVAITHPWEGPRTYVREKVTRGSAAGAHEPSVICLMGGYSAQGHAVSLCGRHRYDAPKLSRRLVTQANIGFQQRVCLACLEVELTAAPAATDPVPATFTLTLTPLEVRFLGQASETYLDANPDDADIAAFDARVEALIREVEAATPPEFSVEVELIGSRERHTLICACAWRRSAYDPDTVKQLRAQHITDHGMAVALRSAAAAAR